MSISTAATVAASVPIPASGATFNPTPRQSEDKKTALNLFWGEDDARDSINYFVELKVQKRVVDDEWYLSVLTECRNGNLTDESYHFLLGLPTAHAGCWPFTDKSKCQSEKCKKLVDEWIDLRRAGAAWASLARMECQT